VLQKTRRESEAAGAAVTAFPDLAGRGPFHFGAADVGAAAHFSVRRRQAFRHPRFDLASVILVAEGHKTLVDQGAPIEADEGEVILVPAGGEADVINAPATRGLYRAVIVCFAPPLLRAFADSHARLIAGRKPLGRIARLADGEDVAEALGRAAMALSGEKRAGPDLLRHRLIEILVLLAERGIVFGRPEAASLAERVGAEIGRDVARPWSAGDVAKRLAVSEATLRRRLSAEGTSFSRILADARLGHGLFLLQSSEQSVVQVALAVGYRSASRFAARFRERFGVPPSDLR
jgi:AraC-like DNA-binding protein